MSFPLESLIVGAGVDVAEEAMATRCAEGRPARAERNTGETAVTLRLAIITPRARADDE
jgi:hypothetical protein